MPVPFDSCSLVLERLIGTKQWRMSRAYSLSEAPSSDLHDLNSKLPPGADWSTRAEQQGKRGKEMLSQLLNTKKLPEVARTTTVLGKEDLKGWEGRLIGISEFQSILSSNRTI